ncbi:protein kinase [Nonomuraea sp. NPDC048826]|uniref:protein kinase domain-containing protein n=1 Tax=Nonomuraea sp. NPDC048826 TaxID=3364347 RepID=UPI00371966A0
MRVAMGETGKLAGRYRLLNPLGGGESLLAFDEVEHRDVVVRRLRAPDGDLDAAVVAARRVARFVHPSIVPVLDVPVEGGEPWLVTAFAEGASLEQTVRGRRPLPVRQAARVGVYVLSALTAAHAAGIVHGRVRPGNVLLSPTGRALLTGFGLPVTGMRPDADLWSLAATLHFAVEGRPPGQAPAEATDPFRALIRAMLTPDSPPVDTVAWTLQRLALDRSLERVVATEGPLSPVRTAAVGLSLLDRLTAWHGRGAHHGGVQPGSVLIDAEGRAALIPPPVPVPPPAYRPPEGVPGPAADLWALGATLFLAVEGRPPAPGASLLRAGPLAPYLVALLAGPPAERPTPAALRRQLLVVLAS